MPEASVSQLTNLLKKCQTACSNYPSQIYKKHAGVITHKSYSHGDKPFAALLLSQARICLQLCMHSLYEDSPMSPSRILLAHLVHVIHFVSDNLAHPGKHDLTNQSSTDKKEEGDPLSEHPDDKINDQVILPPLQSQRRVVEWRLPLQPHPLDTINEEYQLSSGAADAFSNDYTFDDLHYHIKILLYIAVSCCKHSHIAPWHVAWWRRLFGFEDLSDHKHDIEVLEELSRLQRDLSLFTLHRSAV